jgi:hypothetical protein
MVESGTCSTGLEDERVPAHDGLREHPQRDHQREVERRDARHHTERLVHISQVTPRLTSSWLPPARFGSAQPNSTHSMAFSTSALDSSKVFPFSWEMSQLSSVDVVDHQLAQAIEHLGAVALMTTFEIALPQRGLSTGNVSLDERGSWNSPPM